MTQLLESESLYFKCLSFSCILLTTALLFYHMTKFNTMEMNKIASAIFAISLIIISIIYLLLGSYSYYYRLVNQFKKNHDRLFNQELKKEKLIFNFYFFLSIIFILIELAICIQIFIGCFNSVNK
jgi:uncharacterized membrane protein